MYTSLLKTCHCSHFTHTHQKKGQRPYRSLKMLASVAPDRTLWLSPLEPHWPPWCFHKHTRHVSIFKLGEFPRLFPQPPWSFRLFLSNHFLKETHLNDRTTALKSITYTIPGSFSPTSPIYFPVALTIIWRTLQFTCLLYFMLWRRQWHPTPVLLPGKSHGRRSLVGCSPWGR